MKLRPEITDAEYFALLRGDFLGFVQRFFYELNPGSLFSPGPHLEIIASKLEACRLGKCRRLIINLPPRSLKSQLASVAFPAFLLGHDPTKRIICVSYGQELADKHARDTRNVMTNAMYGKNFSANSPFRPPGGL